MGPYSTENKPAAAQLEESPSSRSFFSRFGLPIRSRSARNIADFHVSPTDPHRKYAAGDHVHGAVVLTVIKPIRITHLTVSLHGFVRVYKGHAAGGNEPIVNPAEVPASGGGSRFKYFGNGHASLFQDEQVLSGDGKLEVGKYEFNFDLMFPNKNLPSSIDFERGTISYMITATLTRPTSISPTTTCERKINFLDTVDVGPLAPPRSRTIYLEPISKRSRKRKPPEGDRDKAASEATEPAADSTSSRPNENSTEGSHSGAGEDLTPDSTHNNPRSPVHSDIRSVSGDSAVSGSTGLSRADPMSGGSATSQAGGGRIPGMDDRTITATIELLKGGCLPGDVVSIKISVQHIKRIKSMHGVIVTLYRQGRIDSSPPISQFKELSKEEVKRLEKDEYYPKSRTGLGGLSLTSAGPCSVFRKDLSQAFSPLIIDPGTLSASVNTAVRIPADAFPTIRGVPGEMISFKYQLEVIVDLGGKLAGQLQGGNSSSGGGTQGASVGAPINPYETGAPSIPWGSGPSIIDTDRLRREKGVISVVFEVVVGTVDTARNDKRGKEAVRPSAPIQIQHIPESDAYDIGAPQKGAYPEGYRDDGYGPEDHRQDYPEQFPQEYAPPGLPLHPYWSPAQAQQAAAPVYVPPPEVPDDRNLTEKERIRRAEERLLPSQPEAEAPSAGPSTSAYLNGENIYDADDTPQPAEATVSAQPSAPEASAPTLEDLSAGPGAHTTDDKQELERQRLLADASSPPVFPEDYDLDAAGPSSSAPSAPSGHFEPSAPTLSDEEEYGTQYSYNNMAGPSTQTSSVPPEPLPRYER
ncbi:hypothetical protein GQ53DRAFT_730673 [Thozetella sp. PMI_491]|nr:hypothetical protein GQ53DRAFT_730673 [Thozetella sp. PMI_491]